MARIEDIQAAIESGEVLNIVYHGGSKPGTHRKISPVALNGNRVRATCYTSHAIKTFIVDKIQLVSDSTEASDWTPDPPAPHYKSLDEIIAAEGYELEGLGWHVEREEEQISLHRRFKNGRPLKGSDVSLDYEETTYDLVIDEDGDFVEANHRPKQKPWTVRGKKQTTRSYKSLDHAAEQFLQWSKELAPKN